jgi:sterol desaturase/sphingolipid hydroxylase (fatty acid hydroxylase superfamily)
MPLAFVALLAIERSRAPAGHRLDRRALVRGLCGFAIAAPAFVLVPAWIAGLQAHRHFGTLTGALAAFVLADLVGYVTHRLRHTVPALWRWHQLHHSAERVDVAGAAFLHPIDLAIELAGLGVVIAALGLSEDAAVVAGLLTWLATSFSHLAIQTPQWLGWMIQRPEAHAVHHARGIHAYNYGKVMVWDIVLGTFRNPATLSPEPAGFWDGASSQLARLLAGRDVGERMEQRR